MPTGSWIAIIIAAFIGGAVIAFFVARYVFKKQLQKNPPVNEKMIRVMFQQMGRTPSEKQVREIMRNMNSQR